MTTVSAIDAQAPPLQLVTAAQLDITPEMQPGVDRFRPTALEILARALAAVRHGVLAPCIFIHGPAGSGKSLLATAMVRECEAVWCLDCVANAYRCRSNLGLGAIELAHCAVFVIDAIDLLGGAELQRFYGRCRANGTVLVLMSESRDAPQTIGFQLPATSTVFQLSRENGLTPQGLPITPWPTHPD